ncbi:histone-lysine N-methyltransferase SUVR4-like isoform X5 [Musa acuminata AAA Group]|uniref:histone-lysine N-methyltransferase SUVR4-like isoform X5 n=1 Tax=Musa acuminata AAA Group TaxID=214697 RepID=UPI0008A0E1BD|nr:PREDICTED: histone-lysine N-methyltransferase SUVR4 isoform X5 [Musa acuminata subsp. malaccensis]
MARQKAIAALNAMKAIGIPMQMAKPVLKNLLKVYENNWEYIEAENYRVLADAILDIQESQEKDMGGKGKDVIASDDPEPCRMRVRARQDDHPPPPSNANPNLAGETSQKRPRLEAGVSREHKGDGPVSSLRSQGIMNDEPSLPQPSFGKAANQDLLQRPLTRQTTAEVVPPQTCNISDRAGQTSSHLNHRQIKTPNQDKRDNSIILKEPKVEPGTEFLQKHHTGNCSSDPVSPKDEPCEYDSPVSETPIAMIHPSQPHSSGNIGQQSCHISSKGHSTLQQNVDGSMTQKGQRNNAKESLPVNAFTTGTTSELLSVQESSSFNVDVASSDLGEKDTLINQSGMIQKMKEPEIPKSRSLTSCSLVVVQPQHALGRSRLLHDVNDICKGEERVRISVVNEISREEYPPSFNYIPRNIVYQNAYVSFSLARIGDEDCCADCFSDCLAAPIPCTCARETGGEFAYTSDGLMKKEFLDECISMYREPQKHHLFYCKDCPLERSKNDVLPEACKGHLVRKFVKECWSKCGCSMHCGNRVVQRGITRNLQVFLTSEGKGWGLRTLDELPRGAFVCEYVGEVLTNMELYDRTMQTTGNAEHTYPVLLDADWGSEGALKDEEALCLDATFYGNVARFINHRCFDANLIEIPVEVETPDHHYYHLAFFTTRKLEAFEELTWDYGIDFDDHEHPIKAFKCRCGSRFCRDIKRRSMFSSPKAIRYLIFS